MSPLSAADIDRYRADGYLAPLDVMTESEAATLTAALEQAEARYPALLHAENRNNAHLAFPFLADVVFDQRIVGSVQQLLGKDLLLASTVLFIKEPSSSAFVSWHQDAYYMGLAPDHFVTAWLALTPSTLESGCVSVIPGTHVGAARHEDTFGDDNILTRGQQIPQVDATHAVHLELRPGQMSLHHPWLVHGSQPNQTSSRRIGIAMQSYLGRDVRPARGEHHVTHISGRTPVDEFIVCPRPENEADEAGNQTREKANAALASVLYEGADQTRAL